MGGRVHLRLFIAVRLSAEIVEQLRGTVAALKPHLPKARWVRPEDAHMTLAFLGEIAKSRLDPARQAMSAAVRGKAPFQMALGGLGVFPDWKNSRVVWLGVAQGAAELEAIEGSLRQELVRRDFKLEDRSYHPHLTLCRIHSGLDLRIFREKAEPLAYAKNQPALSMGIGSVDLIESRLTADGPMYTVLADERLSERWVS